MDTWAKPCKCTHSEAFPQYLFFTLDHKGEIADSTAKPAQIATDIKLNQTCQSCQHSKMKCVKQDTGQCANCRKKGLNCVATASKRGNHKPRLSLSQVLQIGDALLYSRVFARGDRGRTVEMHTVKV
ncbi:hypothetical protein K435DRAFT_287663 [Dendrothele bispora CBS 962.96]|uniref:Zn(2)-C6 fungal-type domain-containing protein n=1 Tax=Dendrothele bispora (strain CBS 962.96) TaxID=1314807 RepID=A0A4S8KJQ4_DENBC|nr:hypothetical protein K435DRAFT_287663 [Dendrothele bispora CBS 962.96]